MERAPDSGKRRAFDLRLLAWVAVLGTGSAWAGQRNYTVKTGDSLFAIATRHQVTVDGILEANRLAGDAVLKIGQQLVIPEPRAPRGQAAPAASAPGTTYEVQAGDNLYRIAEAWHVTVDELTALNGLTAKSILQIGQTLRLPASAVPAARPAPPAAPAPAASPAAPPASPARATPVAQAVPTVATAPAGATVLVQDSSAPEGKPQPAAAMLPPLTAPQPPAPVPAPAVPAAASVAVAARPVAEATPATVWVSESRVHLRSGPSTNDASVTLVALGTKLAVTGKDGMWWRVTVPGSQRTAYVAGWVVSRQPVTAPPPPPPAASGSAAVAAYALEARVTVRAQADADSEPVTAVVRGAKLTVVDCDGPWLRVKCADGQLGWVPRTLVRMPPTAEVGSGKAQPDALVRTAMTFVGAPYSRGGTSRGGVDCSGLVYAVCRANGIRLPRTSRDMWGHGTPVSRGNLRAGDLVFFKNTYRSGISHVGIYVGNNQFVHAVRPGRGVTVTALSDGYYQSHYAGAYRVTR